MRRTILALAIAAILVPLAHAETTGVKVKDNFFKPDRVEIKKGDKVRWRWRGSDLHNVAGKKPGSNKIAFASAFKTDGRYTRRFRKIGTWRILCENHPRKMRMKVVVSARGS